ncbi:QRFP-like peptide receptor, partial [Ruditapes philippinarum]|uniref:QRFP-like peptide receptor n=1 Tax=Ruditapes philippinarum TaxID=129788 RepID=UPI00295BD687
MEMHEHRYLDTKYVAENLSNISVNNLKQNDSEMNIPLYIYIIVSIVNTVIFIVGTFGNILVIIVVLRVREMRTPTNVFLLNLSVADVLVLLVCQPAGLTEFFGKDRWFLGGIMCKLVPFMENGVLHVSILTMIAVTLERYVVLCHPLKRKMFYTVSSTIKIVIIIWIIGLTLTSPFLFMTEQEDARFFDGSPIKVCRTKVNETWRYIYTVMITVIFFLLPFLVLVGIYSKIIKQLTSDTLQSLTKNDKSAFNILRSRKQVVKMLIIIIVLFFVTLFPIRSITLWLIFTPSNDVTKIGLEAFLNLISWTRILMYVNSASNPVIYSLMSTKFQRAFKKVLRRNTENRYTATMSARFNCNKNVQRQVPVYKQTNDDGIGDIDNIRNENQILVIKLVIVPTVEFLAHCQGNNRKREAQHIKLEHEEMNHAQP